MTIKKRVPNIIYTFKYVLLCNKIKTYHNKNTYYIISQKNKHILVEFFFFYYTNIMDRMKINLIAET